MTSLFGIFFPGGRDGRSLDPVSFRREIEPLSLRSDDDTDGTRDAVGDAGAIGVAPFHRDEEEEEEEYSVRATLFAGVRVGSALVRLLLLGFGLGRCLALSPGRSLGRGGRLAVVPLPLGAPARRVRGGVGAEARSGDRSGAGRGDRSDRPSGSVGLMACWNADHQSRPADICFITNLRSSSS